VISNAPTAGLPPSAESVEVAAIQQKLPSGQVSPAVIVYARAHGLLSGRDRAAILAQQAPLAKVALGGRVSPPEYSHDGRAAIVTVPLDARAATPATVAAVKKIRTTVAQGLPAGMTAQVTGAAGVTADLASVFNGANTTLLLITVAVVALLLIVTYRSPWLWLVPLLVVGLADQVTSALIAIASQHTALNVSDATTGIVEVLVFGAGTDYALLLIARYREELRRNEDRHQAMHRALLTAGPAIAASGLTVALSLASLALATLPSDAGIGVAGAIGVLCALAFGLLVLPAALVVCGRWLFWPLVPRPGAPDRQRTGTWARLGHAVARRPVPVIAASLAILAVLATGLLGARSGLSQAQQFRTQAQSIAALKTIAERFPAGTSDPAIVTGATARAPAILAAARATPGVAAARITEQADRLTSIDATLSAAPDTAASYAAVQALRANVHQVPGAHALVGGTVAINLDTKNAAAHDQMVVIPVVLAIVLLILMLLLRAVLGPLLLVGTVVASYLAALGAANFAFTHWLGFPALDVSVPLLAFLFLVALGVDYNIFLVSRAREEAASLGTRRGIIAALAVTGGVITSAGILLAAVFAVLGVLPLITLTELGIIVGFGVLLDTLLVRTVLVPALVVVLDRRFWWPGALSRPHPKTHMHQDEAMPKLP
jgi:RND superfamily putative drug exporter